MKLIMVKANNQNTNTPLQWEIAFLLTLTMFPLIGIGPIIAITRGYFFRRQSWAKRLLATGFMVLGFQIIYVGCVSLFYHPALRSYLKAFEISESDLILMLFAFPIIGLIIGFIKKRRHWSKWIIMDSLAILLGYAFLAFYIAVRMDNTYAHPLDLNCISTYLCFSNLQQYNLAHNVSYQLLLNYIQYSFIAFPIVFVLICLCRYRTVKIWGIILSGTALLVINISLLLFIYWISSGSMDSFII